MTLIITDLYNCIENKDVFSTMDSDQGKKRKRLFFKVLMQSEEGVKAISKAIEVMFSTKKEEIDLLFKALMQSEECMEAMLLKPYKGYFRPEIISEIIELCFHRKEQPFKGNVNHQEQQLFENKEDEKKFGDDIKAENTKIEKTIPNLEYEASLQEASLQEASLANIKNEKQLVDYLRSNNSLKEQYIQQQVNIQKLLLDKESGLTKKGAEFDPAQYGDEEGQLQEIYLPEEGQNNDQEELKNGKKIGGDKKEIRNYVEYLEWQDQQRQQISPRSSLANQQNQQLLQYVIQPQALYLSHQIPNQPAMPNHLFVDPNYGVVVPYNRQFAQHQIEKQKREVGKNKEEDELSSDSDNDTFEEQLKKQNERMKKELDKHK